MEATMDIKLLGHTQLSEEFKKELETGFDFNDGQAVSLSAVRTCYSPNNPSEIIELEGAKYFGTKATDGGEGNDADRLLRHIFNSKHTSTVEHLNYTFSIEGVSRALLAQLTRHRMFSFSVQSQRYVGFASNNKSNGFDYVVPHTIKNNPEALKEFESAMSDLQDLYDKLRVLKVPSEDARAVLPNASATNLVMTANLRALLDFYSKRKSGRGGQKEITELAEMLKERVVEVEPWAKPFFEAV